MRGRTTFVLWELDQAKSGLEHMEYSSMIDFAVDGYACVYASAYPDNPALQDWAINGYRLL